MEIKDNNPTTANLEGLHTDFSTTSISEDEHHDKQSVLIDPKHANLFNNFNSNYNDNHIEDNKHCSSNNTSPKSKTNRKRNRMNQDEIEAPPKKKVYIFIMHLLYLLCILIIKH